MHFIFFKVMLEFLLLRLRPVDMYNWWQSSASPDNPLRCTRLYVYMWQSVIIEYSANEMLSIRDVHIITKRIMTRMVAKMRTEKTDGIMNYNIGSIYIVNRRRDEKLSADNCAFQKSCISIKIVSWYDEREWPTAPGNVYAGPNHTNTLT